MVNDGVPLLGQLAVGGSAAVLDVTEASFGVDVVERSSHVPVVVDLWAEWCAPCRQLGPVLEKLATEAAGAWVLAKVDVDANPRLAQALQVQGIPAVKAVVDGQIAAEFTGALPEAQVRLWLSELLAAVAALAPAAGDAPAGEEPAVAQEPPPPPLDEPEIARLLEVVRDTSGADRETAREALLALLAAAPPDDPRVLAARRSLANALY
jgi:putative thioredoxin